MVEIKVIPNNELEALILSYGKDVEVISPIGYREHIRDIIRESYDNYCSVQIECIASD